MVDRGVTVRATGLWRASGTAARIASTWLSSARVASSTPARSRIRSAIAAA